MNENIVRIVTFLILFGNFALNYSLSIPNSNSLAAPIASVAPILFVIMSYFIFKDKLTKQQVAGIVVALFGILFLTTF
ncbi:EamA family transporter [Candidatus Woesebacteria bacterium]|nr:EamA family transporter [Candidatus Woesebacteria bacterium]